MWFTATVDEGLPDDERDALSDAAADIIGDYPEGWTLDESVVAGGQRRDGWLVYQRYQRATYADRSDGRTFERGSVAGFGGILRTSAPVTFPNAEPDIRRYAARHGPTHIRAEVASG